MLKGAYLTTVHHTPLYRIKSFEIYPNLTQAIFTRHGGVSHSPFDTLNLGSSVGDTPEAVATNLQRVCQAVDITPAQTVTCYLVHGAEVLTIEPHHSHGFMGQADGLVTLCRGVYLLMRFADCTPLIFFDPQREVVGLAHAGWRGTMKNIAAATVTAMQRLGSQPSDIIAVIGPAIGACCYEVGTEVIEAAYQQLPQAETLLQPCTDKPNHAYFDLGQANQHQLRASGVTQIINLGLCTACHTDQFFSHRAEKGRTGRFGIVIGLK